MLKLIDVSHWQKNIDFAAVAAAGISGVIVKCIDGRLPDVDPMFEENWAALCDCPELVRGSYAFARPESDGGGEADGRAEAEDYARAMLSVRQPNDEWIACIDLERGGMDPTHSIQQNIDFLGAWEQTCVRLLGRSPWLYTGKYTWQQRMGWTTLFSHLRLWQADWTAVPAEMPWPRTMLQFTSEGIVTGVSTRVDVSAFEGTIEQLRALAQPAVVPRPIGPIFPPTELAGSGPFDPDVARVQGLLLACGYGPAGLVDPATGRPDGRRGPKTRAAYKAATGLESTLVDWVALLSAL
jgi:GH25 family lysozyme M1 (1,4-beta-N-acetylmuramidase)